MSRHSVVRGTGSALPPRRVTNQELAERVDTSHEWIVERTGIHARHIAADGETTATLATEAARKALAASGIGADRIHADLSRVGAETIRSSGRKPGRTQAPAAAGEAA